MIKKKKKIYLEDEIQIIKNQIHNSEAILANLDDKIFFKNKEIDQKRFILSKKIQELKDNKEIILEKKDKNINLFEEIKNLESKIIELDFQQKDDSSSNEHLQLTREKLENIIDKLNRSLFQKNQLEFEKNSKDDLVKIVEKNIFDEQQKLTATEAEVKILETQLSSKRLEVDTWVKTSKKIASDLTRNRQLLTDYNSQINEKTQFLSKAEKTCLQLKNENQKTEELLKEISGNYIVLEKSLASSEIHNNKLIQVIKENQTKILELKSSEKEMQKKEKEIQRNIAKSQTLGSKLTKEKEVLSLENEKLQLELQKKSDYLESMTNEIAQLEINKEELSQLIKKDKIQNADYSRSITQKKEITLRMKNQLNSDIKIYNLLKDKNRTLLLENKAINQSILELEHKESELKIQIEYEQKYFKDLTETTLQAESRKRKLELSVDEKIIERDSKKLMRPQENKTLKGLTNYQQFLANKKIPTQILNTIREHNIELAQYLDQLFEHLTTKKVYAHSIHLIDHKSFIEVKIVDLFDSIEQLEQSFEQFSKKMRNISNIKHGLKYDQQNGKTNIQIIIKPQEIKIIHKKQGSLTL